MRLLQLSLTSFRAHRQSELHFRPGVNLIFGPNGVGKTNVLEAVHVLCLSKSFLTAQDQYILRRGDPYFEIDGSFEGEHRSSLRARMAFVPAEGKQILINGAPLDRLSDVVGMLPIVVFAPDDYVITAGGPDERRKFLNNILSQARRAYMEDVWSFRRAMRQRNELLSQYQGSRMAMPDGLLESWDAEFVRHGSRVIFQRLSFLHEFDRYLASAYATMEHVAERPTIEYSTAIDVEDAPDEPTIAARFQQRLYESRRREREIGRTAHGPHRDELVFRLNDLDVRRYASQGQHRTFGMALKLAQFYYLRDRLDETPILLLDDIFDHLDPQRTEAVLTLLSSDDVGQSILTATRPEPFIEFVDFRDEANVLIAMRRGEDGPEIFEGKEDGRVSARL